MHAWYGFGFRLCAGGVSWVVSAASVLCGISAPAHWPSSTDCSITTAASARREPTAFPQFLHGDPFAAKEIGGGIHGLSVRCTLGSPRLFVEGVLSVPRYLHEWPPLGDPLPDFGCPHCKMQDLCILVQRLEATSDWPICRLDGSVPRHLYVASLRRQDVVQIGCSSPRRIISPSDSDLNIHRDDERACNVSPEEGAPLRRRRSDSSTGRARPRPEKRRKRRKTDPSSQQTTVSPPPKLSRI
ncbi:hypothetical protein F5144DRAFT_264939 [Chaetomium tenue]|uniref:Uncharacterized protein n=1 Tax=Chaetomium tenue TaxID=1854479 RepID=A0ACB7PCJ4_9PEZI|nr:hypothetical protein F5144DRAFT_264939 [Chaetomium globosum]